MKPCDICLYLEGFAETGRTRWNVEIKDNLALEYTLEFESSQLESAAKSGCLICSTIWRGLGMMSRELLLFDMSLPYRGRFILQTACALEVEVVQQQKEGALEGEDKELGDRARVQYYALPKSQSENLESEGGVARAKGGPMLAVDLSAAIGVAKEVPTEISARQSSYTILEWITNCQSKHRSCVVSQPKLSDLPSRVLDIGVDAAAREDADVVLIASRDIVHADDDDDDHKYRYATLSHCWGKTRVIQTTNETLAQRMRCIEWKELPKTFQDAIKIVRALKIRYLWIDSLCIIQDDGLDWKFESARMCTVYSKGYINLAATGASDSRGGCLGSRSLKHVSRTLDIKSFQVLEEPAIFVRPSFEPIHYRYSTRRNSHSELPDSKVVPLLSRAWVFQERQLAPRTLHFHPSEMIMECKTTLSCECTSLDSFNTASRRKSLDINTLDAPKAFDYWFEIVEEYSKLRLTQESDRLPALIGIATTFQRRLGTGYLAGLWQSDVARGLLWDVTRYASAGPDNEARRQRRPRVPSWSWASLELSSEEAGIVFPAGHEDTFQADSRFHYLDNDVIPKAADSSFESSNDAGALLAKGAAVSAIAVSHSAIDTDVEDADLALIFDRDLDDMILISTVGMNLDVAGTDSLQSSIHAFGSYERMGVLDIREDSEIFEEAEESLFSIV